MYSLTIHQLFECHISVTAPVSLLVPSPILIVLCAPLIVRVTWKYLSKKDTPSSEYLPLDFNLSILICPSLVPAPSVPKAKPADGLVKSLVVINVAVVSVEIPDGVCVEPIVSSLVLLNAILPFNLISPSNSILPVPFALIRKFVLEAVVSMLVPSILISPIST